MNRDNPSLGRSVALDVLRGLAIFGMVLSGDMPHGLPGWMYHAQVPPPDFKFNELHPPAGISWVDLVFPFFLFSMGAAIPLAISRRQQKGDVPWKLYAGAFVRLLLLALFAVMIEHSSAWSVSDKPGAYESIRAVGMFVCALCMFARLPEKWGKWPRVVVRVAGAAECAALFATVRFADGTGFDINKNDCIIHILATVACAATVVWLLTSNNLLARLGVMAGVVAVWLSSGVGENWIGKIWNFGAIGFLTTPSLCCYLLIVIPGTIVGDMLAAKLEAGGEDGWSKFRVGGLALASFLMTPLALWVFYVRWAPTYLLVPLGFVIWWLVQKPGSAFEQRIARLTLWGLLWLAFGILTEPFQAGIKKDPVTFSYLFGCAGLASLLLGSLMILERSGRRIWRPFFGFFSGTGQNPMLAYAANGGLVAPLFFFAGPVMDRIDSAIPNPWIGFGKTVLTTILFGLIVSLFTRYKVVMRT